MAEEMNFNKVANNEEVDLKKILLKIRQQKKFIFKLTSVFFFIGVLFAIFSPNEYTANSKLLPQTTDKGGGLSNLSGLAAFAGINLGDYLTNTEIAPTVYPKIVNSTKFKKELLYAKIKIDDIETNYISYFESIYSPNLIIQFIDLIKGLPRFLLNYFSNNNLSISNQDDDTLIKLSENEFKYLKRIENQLSFKYSTKDGIIELEFTMPQPNAAAQMTDFAVRLLQKEIIELKIQKAREQLLFTEERLKEKKNEFELIQNELAKFRDSNQNINNSIYLNQLQKLEYQYNLAFAIYTELSKQVEQAKLKVSHDTPIFMVIDPIFIPIEKSAPKRFLIISIITIIGSLVSILIVMIKNNIHLD